MKDERPPAPLKGPRDLLDGHISGRALHASHPREHLTLARGFEIAVELLVERHPAERDAVGVAVRCLRSDLHVERAGGVILQTATSIPARNRGAASSRRP